MQRILITTALLALISPLHAAGNMVGLELLPGGTHNSAFGVSADGNVVAGHGGSSDGNQAVRWALKPNNQPTSR